MYIVRADIKSRGIDSLCWKANGTQSFSGCSPGNSRSNGMFALSLYCLLGQDVANGYSFSSCQTSSLKLVKGSIS